MGLSRRNFLTGLAAVTGVGALAPAEAALARRSRTIVRTATATRTGEYIYLTFRVPRGVNRVAVGLTKGNPETKVGVRLFDWRGAGYQSPGFRGVYGEESSRFFVASRSASRSSGRARSGPAAGPWSCRSSAPRVPRRSGSRSP